MTTGGAPEPDDSMRDDRPDDGRDEAREVAGCKSPIRLTLRPVREGANPQKEAMKAEDTSESMNAAGMVNMKLEMSDMADPTQAMQQLFADPALLGHFKMPDGTPAVPWDGPIVGIANALQGTTVDAIGNAQLRRRRAARAAR